MVNQDTKNEYLDIICLIFTLTSNFGTHEPEQSISDKEKTIILISKRSNWSNVP